jgi:protocatechuate 3,4-dioxygenase beta subunit
MRTTRLILALLAWCVVTSRTPAAIAQFVPATIAGTVMDQSGDPVAGATVTLYGPTLPGGSNALQTDSTGAFRFTDLTAGNYRIGASKPGFVPVQEGQRSYRVGGRAFPLRSGERRDVRLRLPRLGAITGRIVDERGNPLVNAWVRALEISMSAGYRRIVSKAEARTDDRGLYRLHSLWPDDYLVCASTRSTAPLSEAQHLQLQVDRMHQNVAISSGPAAAAARERLAALEARLPARIDPVRGYAPVCHAAPTGVRATISIGPDDERADVDFRLTDTRLARIQGKVSGLGPDQMAGLILRNQDDALPDVLEGMSIAGEGDFRFWHVPPGRYAMELTERSVSLKPSPVRWLAVAPLVVGNEDATGVVLEVPKSATVRGEVVLRGKSAPPPAVVERVEVRLETARHDALTRFGPYIVRPDASGRFEIPAVLPGSYHLSAGIRDQPPTWFLDAVTAGGKDLLVDTLDIKPGQAVTGAIATLTQYRGSLAGTLLDANGAAVPGAAVLVYPVDERYRGLNAKRIHYAPSSPDGDYIATGLAPGDYRVAPLGDVKCCGWYEPELLRQLDATAVQVSIVVGQQKILNLRVPDP